MSGSGRDDHIGVRPGEVADTKPVASHESKKVILRAERHDTVLINGWFEAKVIQRQYTYYGTRLELCNEDTGRNYELHGGSFDTHLILWESVQNEGGFRTGWRKVGEVSAELDKTPSYDICHQCGHPLRSLEHERLAMINACPKGSDPNEPSEGSDVRTDGGVDEGGRGRTLLNSSGNIPPLGPPGWTPLQRLAAKPGKCREYVELRSLHTESER